MQLHLPFLLALPLGVVAMCLQDFCGTFLVVAESRGNGRLAGFCDGFGDLASVLVTVAGVGSVLANGLTWRSGVVITAIVITSILGTWFWTGRANTLVAVITPKGTAVEVIP